MSASVRVAVSVCFAVILAASSGAKAEGSIPSLGRRQVSSPCDGLAGGNLELAVSRSKFTASDSDSISLGFRAVLGLQHWPEDSVVATSDSVVCAHVDSLIAVWHATPAGAASGVVRNSYWGPTAVVRINPGKYYVWPGLVDDEGFEFNFIVDSVGGSVVFWRTANQ